MHSTFQKVYKIVRIKPSNFRLLPTSAAMSPDVLHLDAAYAGSACLCSEFRHYLDGVEVVDSVSFNPHKWLLTNMDCCCLWVKSPSSLRDSLSNNAEFLRNNASETKGVINYKDWQVALS
ncbi:tyrosine decarboxylase 1-like protein [Cinnamomum micranthum f. kanehirae]|uniref:Tyrosine decarboxylase 1-like protein n=1 Tax=Cinnamomum micranthum f. kanehirae TaxID=337451 RepID=A0A3S3QUX5_9MAGN|nr:tyrosine decarboxylase 1-like protein [Cinnamomum micranthum f. kanehirae]